MNAKSTTLETSQAEASGNPLSTPPDEANLLEVQSDLKEAQESMRRLAADFTAYQDFVAAAQAGPGKKPEGKEAILRQLLPIIDDLEGALDSTASVRQPELRQDIKIALGRLHHVLRSEGVEPTEEMGRHFDPFRHDIVAEECDSTRPENTVLKVRERGYCQHGEVFRPAKVVINVLTQPCVGDGSC